MAALYKWKSYCQTGDWSGGKDIYEMLYEEESQGLDGPEKISTTWPARCHVTYHVHVAELKETAQVPPLPTVYQIITVMGYILKILFSS